MSARPRERCARVALPT